MTSPRRTKAELLAELEAARRQRDETLEQQTATREILRLLSSLPTDVQPVFDAIVESAARRCGARVTAMFRVDDDLVHVVAHHDRSPGTQPDAALELRGAYPQPLSR